MTPREVCNTLDGLWCCLHLLCVPHPPIHSHGECVTPHDASCCMRHIDMNAHVGITMMSMSPSFTVVSALQDCQGTCRTVLAHLSSYQGSAACPTHGRHHTPLWTELMDSNIEQAASWRGQAWCTTETRCGTWRCRPSSTSLCAASPRCGIPATGIPLPAPDSLGRVPLERSLEPTLSSQLVRTAAGSPSVP